MRAPSPTRVAFRSLIAGGTGFENFGKGTDPAKIFRELQDDARYERGSGGYSGTISEKYGFELRSKTPMSMRSAREFASKDRDENDKGGPAFAVPVAESKVKSEKEVVLKVTAKDQYAANEAAKQQIQAKAPQAEVSFTSTTKLKEGALPTLSAEAPPGVKMYEVTYPDGKALAHEPVVSSSKKEAIDAFKKMIINAPYWAERIVKPGAKFLLLEKRPLKTISVVEVSTKLPMWEVKAKVSVVETGPIIGYLFYGWASS